MAIAFDSGTIAAHERADALTTAMQEASAPSHVLHENPQRVHARIDAWEFGNASIIRARASGIQLIRTANQTLRSPAPVLAVAVQQLSDGTHQQGEVRHTLPPGELRVVDLNSPYYFRWCGDGGSTCLYVPLDQLGLPMEVIRRAAADPRESPLYRLVADHILLMTRDADALSADPAAPELGSACIELVRALLASAGHARGTRPVVPTDVLLTEIRAYVRSHLADPDLGPAQIAAAHNVSVRYLYKLCATAEFSLEQWIISQRLDGVRGELTRVGSRNRSIAMVARRWGFRDPSHFARRFRTAYGMSPSDWRRTALADGER
ncbi:helix-turn-helix domain-containing protein [Nocardia sp. NPDC052566]|uniref:helix-turn-helix domain-containing protein n=1 Tax=Nocardia sp. NPDC052566 TaxID=3364330 RepID=UPI0037CAFBDA